MEEEPKDKVPNVEYFAVLKQFEYVLKEILGLPPKRDIDFSINFMPGAAPISKTPYRRFSRRGVYSQVYHLGVPQYYL
jgi:hypothetical protein